MVHFHRCVGQTFGQGFALHKRAAAGRAPVRMRGFGQNCVALAADSFHDFSLYFSRASGFVEVHFCRVGPLPPVN